MKIAFSTRGWEDYLYWHNTDKLMLKKINLLIKEIERNPFEGSGKPEPLKHDLVGCWSRRINLEHRLIYRVDSNSVVIIQCRYHY